MKTIISFWLAIAATLAQVPPAPPATPTPFAAPVPPLPPDPPARWGNLNHRLPMNFFYQSGDRDRDRATDQAERDYDRGKRAIDKYEWEAAVSYFNEVAGIAKTRADGALYWKALALAKLGRRPEANTTLDTLAKSHAQSRWAAEGAKLKTEIAQLTASPMSAQDAAAEDDIKLTAINSLIHADPDRSLPLLEKLLERRTAPRIQDAALRALAQSHNAKAREIVTRVAKGDGNPDLQLKAIRYLGSKDGENTQLLAGIYASSTDIAVKKAILQSYNRDTAKLIEIAKTEKDPVLKNQALQQLGGARSENAAEALASMYSSADTDTRKRILRSLHAQSSAKHLVDVAKAEKDQDLRKLAIQYLSNMRSQEATTYLMDLFK